MGSLATRRSGGLQRGGLAFVLALVVVALLLTMAAPASATSYGAISWGYNGDEYGRGSGQLGDGNMLNADVPVTVLGLSGVKAVSAGGFSSLALLSDGTVMAWGGGAVLGGGSAVNSNVPVPVSGLSGVTAVAAGWHENLAIRADRTVMEWSGSGPVKLVSGLSNVTAVSVGRFHNLALLGDGTMMAWDDNSVGQLGNGTTTSSSTPVVVSGPHEAVGISAGYEHNLAYGPPLPTVIHVNPNIGPATGGTSVTITGPSGTDFTETSAVKFGSLDA